MAGSIGLTAFKYTNNFFLFLRETEEEIYFFCSPLENKISRLFQQTAKKAFTNGEELGYIAKKGLQAIHWGGGQITKWSIRYLVIMKIPQSISSNSPILYYVQSTFFAIYSLNLLYYSFNPTWLDLDRRIQKGKQKWEEDDKLFSELNSEVDRAWEENKQKQDSICQQIMVATNQNDFSEAKSLLAQAKNISTETGEKFEEAKKKFVNGKKIF